MNVRWELEGPGHWLITAWQEGFRRVLESMAGPEALAKMTMHAECPGPQAWLDWASPAWCQLSLQELPDAVLLAGAPEPAVERIGRLISGNPGEATAECRNTFLEVINQTASAMSDTISRRIGRRVSFSPAQSSEAPTERDYAIQMKLVFEDGECLLAVAPGAALMDAVSPADQPEPIAAVAVGLPAGPAGPPGEAAPPAAAPGNLDLLLEVELPVSVTFGRTQLSLKDVLKLSSGSIVELNRLAHEPVEVLINNSVVARGEVVVVEGNYGIRVTEIVSRQERIRSIF